MLRNLISLPPPPSSPKFSRTHTQFNSFQWKSQEKFTISTIYSLLSVHNLPLVYLIIVQQLAFEVNRKPFERCICISFDFIKKKSKNRKWLTTIHLKFIFNFKKCRKENFSSLQLSFTKVLKCVFILLWRTF